MGKADIGAAGISITPERAERVLFSTVYDVSTQVMVVPKNSGIADETGSIEECKAADFVITAGNPLESLRALRKPRMIVARGEKVTPAIKKDVEIEQTLDSLLRYTYEDLDALLAGIR